MSVTNIYQCPECGVSLRYESDYTNTTQCSACFCIIYRDEKDNLSWIRDKAIVKTGSVIQPGSTGRWNDLDFRITGRIRAWSDERIINYWTILFKNGKGGLLSEAYGSYIITNQLDASPASMDTVLNRLRPGKATSRSKESKIITRRVIKVDKWELEGEAFVPVNNPGFIVAEAVEEEREIILSFGLADKRSVSFEGVHIEFDNLHLKNLRAYQNDEHEFTCGTCRKKIQVKRYPYSKSCVCPHCGKFYRQDAEYRYQPPNQIGEAEVSGIPIGSKGLLEGNEYEVTGFAIKEEINEYHSRWREYTLFSVKKGYTFLSEFDGHWIFLEEAEFYPTDPGTKKELSWENEPYQLYNKYNAKVVAASGEFPYQVFNAEGDYIREFISPPEMWSHEKKPDGYSRWFHGKHIDGADISKAFPDSVLPYKKGIGAIQPTGYTSFRQMIVIALFGLLVIGGIHYLIGASKHERQLFSGSFAFDSSQRFSAITSEFKLDKASSNVEMNISGGLNNSWIEVAARLVNKTTGKEYTIEQGVEYYSGFTEGESWSEGDKNESAYFTAIPAGIYVVQLEGSRGLSSSPYQDCNISLIYDVNHMRNMWFAYLFFIIAIIIKAIQVYYYEHSRWRNSPFSNYD